MSLQTPPPSTPSPSDLADVLEAHLAKLAGLALELDPQRIIAPVWHFRRAANQITTGGRDGVLLALCLPVLAVDLKALAADPDDQRTRDVTLRHYREVCAAFAAWSGRENPALAPSLAARGGATWERGRR